MVEKTESQEDIIVNNDLFKGVSFCLCEDIDDFEKVKQILLDKGGKHVNYVSDFVTHLIADNPDHPNVLDAIDIYDKVAVTSQWVLLSEKANILLPLEPFHTDKKNKIFDKLVFSISNIDKEDILKLWAMVTYYGGTFKINFNEKCTHLITTKCKGKKFEKANEMSEVKILTPDWIIDSIKNNSLCEENIYHPKYLITPEYLLMKKEKEERIRLEKEKKIRLEKEEKLRLEREEKLRLEREEKLKLEREEKLRQEKRILEEMKKIEEAKKFEEEKVQKLTNNNSTLNNISLSNSTLVQTKLTNSVVNNSSNLNPTCTSQSVSTITVPAISNQNSTNVPTTQITLRTVSLPSSTFVSNISVAQNVSQANVVNSPIKQGQPQQIRFLLPNRLTRMPQNVVRAENQQIKTRIISPHSVPMTIQQGQVQNIYTDQLIQSNQSNQGTQPIYQQVSAQVNSVQKQPAVAQQIQSNNQQTSQKNFSNNNSVNTQPNNQQITVGQLQQTNPQQITISQPNQVTVHQQNFQQIRPELAQQVNSQRHVYLAFQPQQQPIQYRNQLNFIQIRQQQFVPVQQQQGQQQIRAQQIRPQNQIQSAQQPNTQQLQLNVATNSQKPQSNASNEASNTVHKATNIILQQRVQPPVQMQAQQNQQNLQNIQPMIIQQQGNSQITNSSQINQQQPQQQSIQVLQGQQLIQIQRPVHGQINQQQIIRGQNSQQIIFHQPATNNLQQNNLRPAQLQTIPQGAIFQQSSTQGQIQRVQQLRMPQNVQQPQQQVRLATVSPIHPQQNQNVQVQQTNVNSQQTSTQIKPQRFLIKSPSQYIQQQTNTSMVAIRTPIQQQSQLQSIHNTQKVNSTSPQQPIQNQAMNVTNSPQHQIQQIQQHVLQSPNQHQQITKQIVTKLPNQTHVRAQWAGTSNEQIIRPSGSSQMMQIGTGQVIMSPGTLVQQTGQQSQQIPQHATMILQGQPQQAIHNSVHQPIQPTNQQWASTPITNQHSISSTMVQVRPQNVQMQSQQSQTIRLIQPPVQNGSSNNPFINRLQTSMNVVNNNQGVNSMIGNQSITSGDPNVNNQENEVVLEKYYNYDTKVNVPTEMCLIGCVFYLVEYEQGDFKISSSMCKLIEKNILKHCGQLEKEYSSKVTHVLCESFVNPLVQKALKENKRCVTIFWLNEVLEDKKMRYPFRPWHLPRKFSIEASPCKNMIITTSKFNSNERNRIVEMVRLAKGKHTDYMTRQNNLLICKKPEGIKLKKACEWGIDVVNHLWLQDLWFGKTKEITDKRYKSFEKKDTIDLDYSLIKDLMVGWKASLKLNELELKKINDFKEASLVKNWKKPEVLTTSNITNLKETNSFNSSVDKNTPVFNLINNLHHSNEFLDKSLNSSKENFQGTTNNSSGLSTYLISNQSDTLTIVTVSSCENKNKPSTNTINSFSSTNFDSISSSLSDKETISSSFLSKDKNFDSLINPLSFSELNIKKEKIDNGFNEEINEKDLSKENQMEVDDITEKILDFENLDSKIVDKSLLNTIPTISSTDSITTQSTSTISSLIEIKPKLDNPLNNESSVLSSIGSFGNSLTESSSIIQPCDSLTNGILNESEKNNTNVENTEALVFNQENVNEKTKLVLEEDNFDDNNLPLIKRIKVDFKQENSCELSDQEKLCSKDSQISMIENHNLVSKETENVLNDNLPNRDEPAQNEKNSLFDKSKFKPELIKVNFTGVTNSKELTDIVISLGGKTVNNYQDCTHLVSSKVERTVKFVCCFSHAKYFLLPDWLIKSKEKGFFLKESNFFLRDAAKEEHFGFSIKESLERRIKRNKLLFANMTFFITRSCVPSFKVIIQIIESCGGTTVVKKSPTTLQIERMKKDGVKFLVISCEKDLHLCEKFFENNILVLHSEFVISNILRQKIEYKPYILSKLKT